MPLLTHQPDPDSIDWLNEWADTLCSRDAELAQRAANEIAYLRLDNQFTHRLAVMLEISLLDEYRQVLRHFEQQQEAPCSQT